MSFLYKHKDELKHKGNVSGTPYIGGKYITFSRDDSNYYMTLGRSGGPGRTTCNNVEKLCKYLSDKFSVGIYDISYGREIEIYEKEGHGGKNLLITLCRLACNSPKIRWDEQIAIKVPIEKAEKVFIKENELVVEVINAVFSELTTPPKMAVYRELFNLEKQLS